MAVLATPVPVKYSELPAILWLPRSSLCNVLEQVIRAEGALFKGYYVRRFRRYVEDGMMPGAAASEAVGYQNSSAGPIEALE